MKIDLMLDLAKRVGTTLIEWSEAHSGVQNHSIVNERNPLITEDPEELNEPGFLPEYAVLEEYLNKADARTLRAYRAAGFFPNYDHVTNRSRMYDAGRLRDWDQWQKSKPWGDNYAKWRKSGALPFCDPPDESDL